VPGFLLHQGATVLCAHGGQAQPTSPNPRVKLGGQMIVTMAAPHTVAGCTVNLRCVIAFWIAGATRVRVGGQPVLLQDSQAICIISGGPVNIVRTQTRVRGT